MQNIQKINALSTKFAIDEYLIMFSIANKTIVCFWESSPGITKLKFAQDNANITSLMI